MVLYRHELVLHSEVVWLVLSLEILGGVRH